MKVSSKVVVAILNQYIDVAVNSIHGDTIYLRDLSNGFIRVTTFEGVNPIEITGDITVENGNIIRSDNEVLCYSLKDISGFSIVDAVIDEIIFGVRHSFNDTRWTITSTPL